MPPADYAPYRKLVPPGGVAAAMTPEEAAALARMKAAQEPWSSYLAAGASNLLNTAQGFLPTALGGRGDVGLSDIAVGAVQGASDTASGVRKMMTGETPLFLPDGSPNPAAVATSFDAVGYLTGASAAAPDPGNALRAGVKGVRGSTEPYDKILVVHGGSNFDKIDKAKFGSGEPGGIRPLGNGLYGFHLPMDDPAAAKRAIEGAKTYARKYGRGEKAVQVFSVPKSAILGSNGPIPFEDMPTGKQPQLNSERLPGGDVELSILDPSIATKVGKFKLDTPVDEVFNILAEGGPADTTTLNTGLGGFMQRGMQAVFGPEGKGGGGGKTKAPHPNNPPGSIRAAEVRNGFYLKSEELMWDNPQKKGTAEEFVKYLKNKGVKDREIKALGLEQLQGQMTKEDFIDHLRRKEPPMMEMKNTNFENQTVPYDNTTDEYMMSNYVLLNTPGTLYENAGHGLPTNTLFHNRYTVRQDGNMRVLNVEEAQSDWAQEHRGRFRGTKPDPSRIETLQTNWLDLYKAKQRSDGAREDLLALGDKNIDALLKAMQNADENEVMTIAGMGDISKPKWFVAGKGVVTPEKIFEESAKRMGPDIAQNGANAKYRTQVDRMFVDEKFGNPGAPFVNEGTKAIAPLSLKQAMLKALEVDADEITFTPGEIHAERWAGDDKRKRKGLIDYYDKQFANEMKATLKEISKDSGLDVKFEIEQKPWMMSEYKASQLDRIYGNPYENFGDWQFNTTMIERAQFYGYDPNDMDQLAKAQHVDIVLSDLQSDMMLTDTDPIPREGNFQNIEQEYKDSITTYEKIVKDQEIALEASDLRLKKAQERGAPSDEIDVLAGARANAEDNLNGYRDSLERTKRAYASIPEAKRVVQKWRDEVQGKAPPKPNEGLPAMVLRMTPELKDYIRKNGLPRFAKGGIVDLAVHGAWV